MCGKRAGSAPINTGSTAWASASTSAEKRPWNEASPTPNKLHGHRYARMRGLAKVQQQCLLAATAQNIKKIALLLSRMGPDTPFTVLTTLMDAYQSQLQRYQNFAKNLIANP